MKMHIDKYKQPDGTYKDVEGCIWNTPIEFIIGGVLGFCCCMNESSLEYIRDVLEWIDTKHNNWESQIVSRDHIMFNSGITNFTFSVFDNKGLIEHSGSLPGWLTEHGRCLLRDLNELLTEK